jgi:hypothetical protein
VVLAKLPRKLHKKERYTILRADNINTEQRRQIIEKALEYRGFKLDHAGLVSNIPARLFGITNPLVRMAKERLWCSQLIYNAYLAAGIELVSAERAASITSDDLIRSPQLRKVK